MTQNLASAARVDLQPVLRAGAYRQVRVADLWESHPGAPAPLRSPRPGKMGV